MKKPTLHTRWHCFNINTNAKMIRKFGVDETQPTQHNADFTPWKRGTGPHSAEARAKCLHYNRLHFKGVPKTDIQKQKMSNTKLGKKFTAEHRKKLSESWKGKREMKRLRTIEAFKIASEVAEAHYNTND
tara:strand:+ start:939 stop:1328 length:390 start_codon:yes stop_codon:yes gene_type:complete